MTYRNLARHDLFDQPGQLGPFDQEIDLVARFTNAVVGNGIDATVIDAVNFYVALKSKPLVLLVGTDQSNKIALVQYLASLLVADERFQYQEIPGHPGWANGSNNVAIFTELQSRLATQKVLNTLEEAMQPENTQRLYIVCMVGISPAELLSFFTEVAFQLAHGRLMRIGGTHFVNPIPYPKNFILIGTIELPRFVWWDEDLLAQTTIIQWPAGKRHASPLIQKTALPQEREFLRSCLHNKDGAYRNISPILAKLRQPLDPLLQVASCLRADAVSISYPIIDDVMIYLANSWSKQGHGLFDPLHSRNLAISLDLAIAQILLPHAADKINRLPSLRKHLERILSDRFPYSSAFLLAQATQV